MPLSLHIENVTERTRADRPAICAGCGSIIIAVGLPHFEVWAVLSPDNHVNILSVGQCCRGPCHNRLAARIFEYAIRQLETQPRSLLTPFECDLSQALGRLAPQSNPAPCPVHPSE